VSALEPFWRRLEASPERLALVGADAQRLTYADLDRWSVALGAAYRRAGIGAGVRVLVALGMTPTLYAVLMALWRLGAVAVFPEPAAGLAGLAHAVRMASPRAYVGPSWLHALCRCWPGLPRLGRRLPATTEQASGRGATLPPGVDDPALITFTSGSTGRPKGIVRSHGFLRAQLEALTPLLAGGADDVDLVSLPMFVLANLGLGTPSVIPDGPLRRPAAMEAARLRLQMAAHGVTRLVAPPSVCAVLAEGGGAPLPLRRIATGGGPVFPNLLRALAAAAPQAEIVAVYGSTEAEPIAHVALSALSAEDWRAMETGGGLPAGHVVPQVRLRLEDGEIVVTGPNVNKAYLDAADDARAKRRIDGEIWHATGDAGRLDPAGRLWLLGRVEARIGDLHPFAVEAAALAWPGVRQAALVPVGGPPVLAVSGTAEHEPGWRERATAFPGLALRRVERIPLDRRHNAKVDYPRLRSMLR
jgi:acyl-coenzyme A synthetase/AMP-(fatty) acid ligase